MLVLLTCIVLQAALRAVLGSERAAAKATARAGGGAPRHSRFGGTFVKPLPGGGAAFVHANPEAAPAAPPMRGGRGAGGRGKPRLVGHQRTLAEDPGSAAAAAAAAAAPGGAQRGWTASTAVQTQLKEFAEKFLAGPYNALMGVLISDLLVGRAPGLSEHEIEQRTLHFMNVATFATAFVRVDIARKTATAAAAKAAAAAAAAEGGDAADSAAAAAAAAATAAAEEEDAPSPWAAVAETMDARAFHWVRTEWLRLCDLKGSEAGVAAAGALLKEMLAVLLAALSPAAGSTAASPADGAAEALSGAAAADRRVATALALQVLTDDTADEGILANLHKLVKSFDPRRFARSHMATLAAALHTVLALLRALSEAADGALHVTRKRAKRAKKKVAAPIDPDADPEADPNAAAPDAEAGANGGAAGAGANGAAAGGDAAGGEGGEGNGAPKEMDEDKAAALADAGIDMGDDDEDLEEDGPGGAGSGSDGGEGTQRRRLREVRLDLPKRVARLVDAQTVCNYVWLLKHWRSNDAATNDVACAFLERLEKLSLAPMLYQLSVLTILHDVIADPAACREPRHARLHAFCRRTTRGMFERLLPPLPETPAAAAERPAGGDSDSDVERAAAAAAEEAAPGAAAAKTRCAAGRMLCVDLLFWKQRTQALQLEIDFGRMSEDGPTRPKVRSA